MTDNMQIDDGRVIIDTKMWSTYNSGQTVNLEAFDNPLSEAHSVEDDIPPIEHDDYGLYESEYQAIQATGHHGMSRMSRRRQPTYMQANSVSLL